jgi:hypothetical protein
MCLSIFLFLSELGTYLQNSYPQEVWNIEKTSFSAKEYAEIHIQRPFLDNKKDIKKLLY